MTSPKSYSNIRSWVRELASVNSERCVCDTSDAARFTSADQHLADTPKLIVKNKCDLAVPRHRELLDRMVGYDMPAIEAVCVAATVLCCALISIQLIIAYHAAV